MKLFRNISFIGLALFSACASYTVDPYPNALSSNDLTLVLKSCDGPISSGIGICRVTAGTAVVSSWQAILPTAGGVITGGELAVQVRDVVKTYAITGPVVNVPLSDFYGPTWQANDNDIMNATATMKLTTSTGLQGVMQVEGQVFIRSLPANYQPMPIDSGYEAWTGTCKVQYSSSGRSAVKCK